MHKRLIARRASFVSHGARTRGTGSRPGRERPRVRISVLFSPISSHPRWLSSRTTRRSPAVLGKLAQRAERRKKINKDRFFLLLVFVDFKRIYTREDNRHYDELIIEDCLPGQPYYSRRDDDTPTDDGAVARSVTNRDCRSSVTKIILKIICLLHECRCVFKTSSKFEAQSSVGWKWFNKTLNIF